MGEINFLCKLGEIDKGVAVTLNLLDGIVSVTLIVGDGILFMPLEKLLQIGGLSFRASISHLARVTSNEIEGRASDFSLSAVRFKPLSGPVVLNDPAGREGLAVLDLSDGIVAVILR